MKPENDPAYETRLLVKINELMLKGNDYYPINTSNLVEFLANMNSKQAEYLSEHLINRRYEAAGLFIEAMAHAHWKRLARIEAEARLAEEYDSCERCGGTGCSDCDDKEHDDD
jgi:hypothetical protein